jgi:UDP-N-acetylmuramyl pentapeptide phosphotransferase/UDP-N-acetylglucosamine-1-phosphate transferase
MASDIIDWFNGRASMVAFIMFASLAYVAFQVHDPIVPSASLIMMGAVMGFFIWNFPAGLIFLGDGGAYARDVVGDSRWRASAYAGL